MVASLVSSCASRRRSSVTSRTSTSGAGHLATGQQRDRAQQAPPHRWPASSSSTGSPVGRRPRCGASRCADRSLPQHRVHGLEVFAGHVAGVADPPVRRQRVGAGVDDLAHGVHPHHAVTDARRVDHLVAATVEREPALGDHLGQVRRAAQVGEFQRARRAGHGQVRVAGQHRDDVDRRGGPASLPAGPGRRSPTRGRPRGRSAPRARQVATAGRSPAVQPVPDQVVLVGGRTGGRAAPARRSGTRPPALRHQQQQVGEGQVGQQGPLAHQAVQVIRSLSESSVLRVQQLAESGHCRQPARPSPAKARRAATGSR